MTRKENARQEWSRRHLKFSFLSGVGTLISFLRPFFPSLNTLYMYRRITCRHFSYASCFRHWIRYNKTYKLKFIIFSGTRVMKRMKAYFFFYFCYFCWRDKRIHSRYNISLFGCLYVKIPSAPFFLLCSNSYMHASTHTRNTVCQKRMKPRWQLK